MRSTATEAANTDIQTARRMHFSLRSRVDRTRFRGLEEGPERPTERPSGVRQASGAGAPGRGEAFGPRSSLQGGNARLYPRIQIVGKLRESARWRFARLLSSYS